MNRDELIGNLNQMLEDTVSLQVWAGFEPRVTPLKTSIKETVSTVIAEFDRLTADRDSEHRWADEYHQHAEEMTAECKRLTARIAELEAAQAWVSVEERLPEEPSPTNVTIVIGVFQAARIRFMRETMYCGNGIWADANPTHWMPMPQLPSGPQSRGEA